MTHHEILETLETIFDWLSFFPGFAGMIKIWLPRIWRSPDLVLVRRVYAATKWTVPIWCLCKLLLATWWLPRAWWIFVTIGWVLICLDKDDDEWWKRYVEKAWGKVTDLGHRLVVKPAPA